MQKRFTASILFLFLFTALHPSLLAQVFSGNDAQRYLQGAEMVRIDPESKRLLYVRLDQTTSISEEACLAYFKKVYHLSEAYQFELMGREKDGIGFTHLRYRLKYNNYPLIGAMLIAHFKDDQLQAFNGDVFTVELAEATVLEESTCLQIALDSVQAEVYLWEIPEEEASIREIKQNPKATWFPKGELVYVPLQLDFSRPFRLAYQFTVHAYQPRTGENIYIDAVTGQLLARENLLHNTDVPGKAQTKYSGLQNITTDSTAPFNYRLRENSRGNGIYTLNMRKGTNYGAASDFLDSNNFWNNVNANKDEVATDAHWGAEKTYDYYKQKFNRNSYNNNNARIYSYVHYANNYDNAFWDGLRMTYGDGNTFKPLVSIDVCGHEITHAVTTNTAGLIYSYESGQLNESFSDIFGNAIERFGKPNSYSWIIGEDITNNGSGLRNMSDPRLKNHPRCYKGTNWYYGTGDNGGVHLNSGVQNWWFYLITEGGSGSNDFSKVYRVDSLGIETAEQIAYRNLTVYLTPSSQYADARFYSIQSAIDLYGNCSKEVIAVTNAWYACNVGPAYDSGLVKADFIADTVVCSSSKTVNFTNLSSNASSSYWTFGDGNSSSVMQPTHVYGAYGSFTVKLVVNSCFKNKKDSLTKVAYVKIDSTFDLCNAVFMPLSGIDSTHKCASFVYDDGAEDVYKQQRITYLRISTPEADSIRLHFLDFDYELNYDSLYIYKGKYPGGVKIGGYTGSTLPNGGKFIVVNGDMITLRHVSDPYVVGRGFKLYYQSFKKPVDVTAFSDTTICYGNSTLLHAKGKGGYSGDYKFQWKNIANRDSILVSPKTDSSFKVYLSDVCTGSRDSATVRVQVRKPLHVEVNNDTVLCAGAGMNLIASGSGGLSSNYRFDWDNGLGSGNGFLVKPLTHTTYRVILSDGCTPKTDTAYVQVRVKDALKVKAFSRDTIVCFNKQGTLEAQGSGGDTLSYFYGWSHGLGIGPNIMFNLFSSQMVKVTLMDACSAQPATDSIYILVRDPLSLNLNEDTLICKGTSSTLIALAAGGDSKKYSYQWTPALADTAIQKVNPPVKTQYKVTLTDNCSNAVNDSVWIDVMAALEVSGLKDTTICNGMEVPLVPVVSGGRPSTYTYTWNPGLSSAPTQLVKPTGSFSYRVIVNDGCTVFGDTAIANITVKNALQAKISSADTLICYGKTSNLAVSGSGGIATQYQFNWSHGLGNGLNPSINLFNSTWIQVTLSDGCTVLPSTDSIYIQVRPELKVNLPADTTICYGGEARFNALASGGDLNAYNYTWTPSLLAQSNQTVKPITNTKYKVVLSDACSDDAVDSILIRVLPALKISGLRDTTICYGGSAFFNPLVSGGVASQYNYSWNQGLSTNANQTVAPTQTTSYQLNVEDACTVPGDSQTIRVTVRPALLLNLQLSQRSICETDSALLRISQSGGIPSAYQFTLNGNPLNSDSVWLKPALAGTHTYSVNLTDNCSDPASGSQIVLVNPQPVVDFTTAKTEVCRLDPLVFTNLSTGAVSYTWQLNPADSLLKTKSPTYVYKQTGIYDITLTAKSDSGCISTLKKPAYIEVFELPVSDFSYLPEVPDFLKRDIGFTNLSTNYTQFEWDFGDFMTEKTQPHPMHKYGDTGSYPVRLLTINSIGCRDTLIKWLRVKDVFRVYFPNAISMNSDNVNDSFIILGRGIQWYNLQIFNRWGEKVYEGNIGDKAFDGRDRQGLPLMKGSYLINLTVRDFEGFLYFKREMLEIL